MNTSTLSTPFTSPFQVSAADLRDLRGPLLRYVSKLLSPDLHHAEDIVQETLLRAWLLADRLHGREHPIQPWLYRTARELARNDRRKERSIPIGIACRHQTDAPDSDDFTDTIVDRDWLLPALRKLPRRQREALVYLHMVGFGGAEIAERLQIPRGTVKSRTYHAVRSMRRKLFLSYADEEHATARPGPRPGYPPLRNAPSPTG
jgi:RNA polymerase sigma-70 factor (ECF subfamily)